MVTAIGGAIIGSHALGQVAQSLVNRKSQDRLDRIEERKVEISDHQTFALHMNQELGRLTAEAAALREGWKKCEKNEETLRCDILILKTDLASLSSSSVARAEGVSAGVATGVAAAVAAGSATGGPAVPSPLGVGVAEATATAPIPVTVVTNGLPIPVTVSEAKP